MRKLKRILLTAMMIMAMLCVIAQPAFALEESEVQAQVDAVGKEAVTGNVLIWFLCAIAFLKVSQKIDSFMSSLGINVGHTGGSMLSEAMIAARSLGSMRGSSGSRGGHSSGSAGGSSDGAAFLSGGLAGIVSRQVTAGAVKSVTASGNGACSLRSKVTALGALSSQSAILEDPRSRELRIKITKAQEEIEQLLARLPKANETVMEYINKKASDLDKKIEGWKIELSRIDDQRSSAVQNLREIEDAMENWEKLSNPDKLTVVDAFITSIRLETSKVSIDWKL